MANLFYVPWAIIRDVAGIGIPGAQILFTQTGGNTKKSVYHDASLTTPHTNPVICDGVGNPPIIYMDPTVSYRVRLYDRDAEAGVDTPIPGGDIDPYVPGIFADATALQPVADDAANSASAATNSAAVAAAAVGTIEGIVASANDMNVQAQAAVTSIAAALGPSILTLSQLVASGMPLNARWFGSGSTEAEINAAILESEGLRNIGEGYASAGPPVYAPYGDWTLNSTLTWIHPLQLFGDFCSGPSGGGTVLKTASNITALMPDVGSSGSIIRNLYLQGSYSSTESEAHGIHFKDKATIRDVFIISFAGDGIHADTIADSSNINDSEIHHPFIQGCRNAIYLRGSDANAVLITHPECFLNRRYGWWMLDGIGGTVLGGDYSSNGSDIHNPTSCVYNGGSGERWYFVLPNQEAGAKANPPSGTTSPNTYWGLLSTGSPGNAADHPTWANTIDFRTGGVFRVDGASERCSVFGGYDEGDQPPAQLTASSLSIVIAPQIRTPVIEDGTAYGGYITGNSAEVTLSKSLTVPSNLTVNGSLISFSGSSPFLTINATSGNGAIVFADAGVNHGFIQSIGSSAYYDATAAHIFRIPLSGSVIYTIGAASVLAKVPIGYDTGAGGAVTQATSRTTGVTLNSPSGAITLFSAAGSATWQTFTVTNSSVAATDTIRVCQKSGTDLYQTHVTNVAAGSFKISFATTGGTTTEQPVFNYSVIRGATS